MRIIIGSRGSKLALWQAAWVRDRLSAAGYEVETRIIKTTGDRLTNVPVSQAGTKGFFTKEIEEALADGSIHLAVHSLKDLPTEQPAGLYVGAVPEREDPRDVFISRGGTGLAALPAGSRVGTSSLRREAQLRALRRDLNVVPMRGNIDTRLGKLERGECEALTLAAAGLARLGLAGRITSYFALDQMCPAVGQGALAIEIRRNDDETRRAVEALDHAPTHLAVRAERTVLLQLGGGCQVPIAAHARAEGNRLLLRAMVASPDGAEIIRASAEGAWDDPEGLGSTAARDLLERGARSILESIHA